MLSQSFYRHPYVILFVGVFIAIVTFGPRATMGFFLVPMSLETAIPRESFAFAIALQNLVWGVGSLLWV